MDTCELHVLYQSEDDAYGLQFYTLQTTPVCSNISLIQSSSSGGFES